MVEQSLTDPMSVSPNPRADPRPPAWWRQAAGPLGGAEVLRVGPHDGTSVLMTDTPEPLTPAST